MSKDTTIAVSVKNLHKSFKLPHEKHSGVKQKIINTFKRNNIKGYEIQKVLRGIDFDIKQGEFFGIVGRNGSGKSTLLKTLAGIYTPDEGVVQVNGSLVPFIELGVGFNPELTGRENIFLNGALLGFSHGEMEVMYEDIVEFAELDRFMDQKLKNYSSGMQVRLAFSIAIKARGDILILDEVLAVGDEAFQKKCNEYFEEIRRDDSKTVILVTHSMESVRRYCNRAILLVDGKIVQSGSPDKVASAYSKMFIDEQIASIESAEVETVTNGQLSDVKLDDISVVQNGTKVKTVEFNKDFSIGLDLFSGKKRDNLVMGVHFIDQSGRVLFAVSTKTLGGFKLNKGSNKVYLDIQNILTDGNYYINIAIEEAESKTLLLQNHEVSPFTVVGLNLSMHSKLGMVYPDVKIRYQ